MAISNKTGRILLTTGNKSEMAVGYTTAYGDMAGGVAPMKDLPKLMVYRLARLVDSNENERRQAPPGVRITRRAFGRDRRYPLTNGF